MNNRLPEEMVQQLEAVMEQTVEVYAQLKETILEEKEDIVLNRSCNLEGILKRKEELTISLQALNDQRLKLTAEIAGYAGEAPQGMTVTRVIGMLSGVVQEKMTELRDRLKKLIADVQSENSTASFLISSGMKFVKERLNIVNQIKPVTTYGRNGKTEEYSFKQGNMVSYAV